MGKVYYVKNKKGQRRLAEYYLQNLKRTRRTSKPEKAFFLACHIVEGGSNWSLIDDFQSIPSHLVNGSDEVKAKQPKTPTNQTIKQLDSQTAKRPINQTTKQPNNQTTKQPNNQTAKQPNNQTAKQPNSQTAKQPNNQTTKQPNNQKAK